MSLDGLIGGQLDGAHMLTCQPFATAIGFSAEAHIVTHFPMDLNGNGVTVSNDVWMMITEHVGHDADGKPAHLIPATALSPVVEHSADEGKPFNMGMFFPVSTHNYELRQSLAAGGIKPGDYSPRISTCQRYLHRDSRWQQR